MERASICISLHVCTTCIPYAYHMHEPPRVYHIPAATAQWLRGGCTGDDLLVRAQWLRGGCTGDDLLVRATPPPMETILSPPSTYLLTSLPTYTVHTRRQATAARTPNTPSHPVTQSRTAPHIARRRSQQRCYLAYRTHVYMHMHNLCICMTLTAALLPSLLTEHARICICTTYAYA